MLQVLLSCFHRRILIRGLEDVQDAFNWHVLREHDHGILIRGLEACITVSLPHCSLSLMNPHKRIRRSKVARYLL